MKTLRKKWTGIAIEPTPLGVANPLGFCSGDPGCPGCCGNCGCCGSSACCCGMGPPIKE